MHAVTDTIPEAIEVQSDVLNSSNYMIFSSYEESRLFQIVPPTNNDSLQYVVDSVVLGLILTNGNFSNLKNPIKITLQSILIQENMVKLLTNRYKSLNHACLLLI